MEETIERIDRLEFLLERFIENNDKRFQELWELHRETDRKIQESNERIEKFMKESSVEQDKKLEKWKAEWKEEVKQMNKKWGEISNKLGTIVEDLVYPSIGRIIKEKYGVVASGVYLRALKRLNDGREKEFDAYAITRDYVFLNSTKATLDSNDVKTFIADINDFRLFCPEYNDKPLIGILASLQVHNSVLAYAEKLGYMVLGVGFELMEVKNTEGFEPKLWYHRP
ncbi:hypothetical protein MCHI_001044 [Candidatus Magnetoovum chiemensis]|nr:hypothetical protein MCHI_001044 [Candidatus Magnetoovum chiemensis]